MRFIESILFKDGEYHNLPFHQQRVDRTFEKFFNDAVPHQFSNILPKLDLDGTYKARVVYDCDNEDADFDLAFNEYTPRQIRTLELVDSEFFDYSFKYEDRSKINALLEQSKADDIIICIDGKVTDGSYFNLVFWNGKEWITPNSPMLDGVRKSQLLKDGKIREASISKHDIHAFEKVSLINAMLDLGELEVPIHKISTSRTDD